MRKSKKKFKDFYSVDIETTKEGYPFCLSITDTSLETKHIRWDLGKPPLKVKKFLENRGITKIFHNASFDLLNLENCGLKVKGEIHDTMIMAKICLPFSSRYGLRYLMKDKRLPFKEECRYEERVKQYYKEGSGYDEMPRGLMKRYNSNCSYFCMLLFWFLKDVINNPVYSLEQKQIAIVMQLKKNGIKLNVKRSRKMLDSVNKKIRKRKKSCLKRWGLVNPNSTKQLGELIFIKMQIPVLRMGKTYPSLDKGTLYVLRRMYPDKPIFYWLLKYRKLVGRQRFLKQLLDNEKDGFIYPNFNTMGEEGKERIRTGRYSSSKPNLQNLPRGKVIRKLIVPRKDYFFLDIDYNQIEIVLFAYLSKDKLMMRLIKNNEDIHAYHKEKIIDSFRPDPGGNRDNRFLGKITGFQLIYGISPKGLLEALEKEEIFLTLEQAITIHEKWHQLHPSLERLKEKYSNMLDRNGFLHDAYHRYYYMSKHKRYLSVNYMMQGMSANILKDVLPKVNRLAKKYKGYLILTVHDEVVIELPLKYIGSTEVYNRFVKVMETPAKKLNMPITVDYKILTNNWGG